MAFKSVDGLLRAKRCSAEDLFGSQHLLNLCLDYGCLTRNVGLDSRADGDRACPSTVQHGSTDVEAVDHLWHFRSLLSSFNVDARFGVF